jgi:methionyl-tRNA formyltransferase
MRILLLSPYPERIIDTFCDEGDEVTIRTASVTKTDADFIVSYGYRYMLRRPIIGTVPAINLHISYLPWNRGADSNLWSWIDGTPKGVTIHDIDEA